VTGFVLNRDFDAYRIRQFHLVNLWFQAESKGIEPKLQDLFECADTFRPIADKPEVEIFSSPGAAGETEFHRYTAFEVVGVDHAPLDSLFEYTAESKKRDPTPQAFLFQALLACNTGKNFLKTLRWLWAHAVACLV
jgi:hypothetical protein